MGFIDEIYRDMSAEQQIAVDELIAQATSGQDYYLNTRDKWRKSALMWRSIAITFGCLSIGLIIGQVINLIV